MSLRRPTAETRARLIGAGLALAALAYHLAGLGAMGLTDDDQFYVPAAVSYAHFWAEGLDGLVHGSADGFARNAIDRRFRPNHEHPPLAKYVMGASYWLFHEKLGWLDTNPACRVGVVLLAMLCTYLVFSFGRRAFGIEAGIFAAVALNLLPRLAFHCRVPTLDLPVTTMYLFTAYAAWRAQRSLLWGVLAGPVFGLALATKLNAPFAVLPLGIYWLWRGRKQFRRTADRASIELPPFTVAALSMLLLGPLVFYLSWPWIWHDTMLRLGDYVRFHLHHYGIYLFYLGRIYGEPFAPWHAPFVLLLSSTPPMILVLAARGALSGLGAIRWRALSGLSEAAEQRDTALFLLLNALFCVGVVAFPDNPVYGGVKLFLPALPFIALLAGSGFIKLVEWLHERRSGTRWPVRLIAPAAGALLLLPATIGLWRAHPYLLSYYGPLVGGVRGAYEAGLERQYYDVFYPELAFWLSDSLPEKAKIAFEPNNKEYRSSQRYFRESGELRRDLQIVNPRDAEYLVLTHERRWRHYPELLRRYRERERLWELDLQGVPLLTVFKVH